MVVADSPKPLRPSQKETREMVEDVRRGSFRVFMGTGEEQWSLADPGHPVVSAAQRHVRYSAPLAQLDSHALVLASVASDMAYLVHDCPSTKLACEKLAKMRAAVRKLGPVEGDDE